jgi:hypothetical protein
MALSVRQSASSSGASPVTLAYGSNVPIGDYSIAAWTLSNTGQVPSAVADSINGAMASISAQSDATNSKSLGGFGILANASGTPSVQWTAPSYLASVALLDVTGFAGVATADNGFNGGVPYAATTATTAIACTPVSNFNNEILIAVVTQGNGSYSFPTPSGWTLVSGGYKVYYQICATAGTSAPFNSTLTGSTTWDVAVFGVYDHTGAVLAAVGNCGANGAANLKTGAALAAGGAAVAMGLAGLNAESAGYASVTLAGPLFTGVGSILSAYANWSIQPPVIGSVIWYDPTYMTILPDGEIVGTTNNFSALAQFYTGSAWSDLTVLVTPGLSAVSYGEANGHATITTGIPLGAIGSSVAQGLAALSTMPVDQIAAIGRVVANGAAALTTGIDLVATGNVAANGAAFLLVGAGLAAVGNAVATGYANLSVPSQLHATANVAANGLAILSTGSSLAAHGQASANGCAAIVTAIEMRAVGQAAANGVAGIITQILLNASGSVDAEGVANLAIGASLQAIGSAIANGSASIVAGQLVFATGNVAANGLADFTADGPADPVSIWNQVPGKFNPILGIEQPPLGVFACGIGMEDFYGIDWTIWLAQRWAAGALVAEGYAIQPWPATGFQYVCTQAGASGSSVPAWPLQNGATCIDGSVIWTAEPVDFTSLLTTVVSAQWSSLNGPLVAIGEGYEGQLTPVLIITNGCISGTTYPVECIVSLANETTMTGTLLFEVH